MGGTGKQNSFFEDVTFALIPEYYMQSCNKYPRTFILEHLSEYFLRVNPRLANARSNYMLI